MSHETRTLRFLLWSAVDAWRRDDADGNSAPLRWWRGYQWGRCVAYLTVLQLLDPDTNTLRLPEASS